MIVSFSRLKTRLFGIQVSSRLYNCTSDADVSLSDSKKTLCYTEMLMMICWFILSSKLFSVSSRCLSSKICMLCIWKINSDNSYNVFCILVVCSSASSK